MRRRGVFSIVLWILLCVSLGLGLLSTGPAHVSWSVMRACLIAPDSPSVGCEIFWHLRFLHLLSLGESGMALGGAGLLFQGLLKNPLADPGLLGVSAGAGFLMLLGMVLASRFLFLETPGVLMLCAVGGALGIVWIGALCLQSFGRKVSPFGVILLGILLNAFFIALTEGILLIRPASTLQMYFAWSLSGEARLSLAWMGYLGVFIVVLLSLMARMTQKLDLWQLGLEEACALGVNPQRFYYQILTLASLLTACSVLLTGPIAFVGLLAPHFGRALVGPRHGKLLPATLLMAVLLVWGAGWLCALVSLMAIPLSLMLTVIGVPSVMILLVRQGRVFYE